MPGFFDTIRQFADGLGARVPDAATIIDIEQSLPGALINDIENFFGSLKDQSEQASRKTLYDKAMKELTKKWGEDPVLVEMMEKMVVIVSPDAEKNDKKAALKDLGDIKTRLPAEFKSIGGSSAQKTFAGRGKTGL